MQIANNHSLKQGAAARYGPLLIVTAILSFLGTNALGQQFNYNFDSLKRVIDLRPADTSSIRAYVDYAAKFFYIKSDSGLYYIQKGLQLARRQPDNHLYLYALKNKGDFYSVSGDFKTATAIYRQGLATRSGVRSWLLKVKILANLGTAYKNRGMLDSAQVCFQKVTAAFSTHKNGHADSLAWAFSYFQLYDLYQVQGLKEEAIYYGQKGYELSRIVKAERGIAYGLFIQAIKYEQADPVLALQYCDEALNMAIQKNIPELQQFTRGLKAKILIARKEYRKAEAELLPSTRFTAGSVQQVIYAKLAEVYYYLDEPRKALSYFNRSYELATTSGYRSELADALSTGIAIYVRLKNYEAAYRLQKQYQEVQQQITSDKLKLDFQRAALKFKTAEKDKQLAQKQLLIAQKDNRLNRQSLLMILAGSVILLAVTWWALDHRQQKKLQQERDQAARTSGELQTLEAMMKGEEKERVRIAKDLHDGIGGLLSAVKMRFSTLKNTYPELKTSAPFGQALAMLDNASSEIRKTAHNLLPDILTRFGLEEAVQVFCANISQQNKLVVDYQSVGHIGRFPESFELTVYRIVQELLNNVIKHAQASQALVQFTRRDGLLTISIEDDGIGFDARPAHSGEGMGLSSVRDRVRALKGTMETDTAPGKGTAIYLEFEIDPIIKHSPEFNEPENSYR